MEVVGKSHSFNPLPPLETSCVPATLEGSVVVRKPICSEMEGESFQLPANALAGATQLDGDSLTSG